MSTEIEPIVPPELRRKLERSRPPREAVVLTSIDAGGYPHFALLSFFETLLLGGSLAFFVAESSTSRENLADRFRCTLGFISPEAVYYVKGHPQEVGTVDQWTVFRLAIETVLQDRPAAHEQESRLTSSMRFEEPVELTSQRRKLRQRIAAQLENTQTDVR